MRTRISPLLSVILVIVFIFSAATFVPASEVRLSVAASMTDVFKDLIGEYSKAHKEIKVLPNFGSSGGLAKQVVQGAPADLFVSANIKWLDFLIADNRIQSETLHTLAHNSLVLVGREAGSIQSLLELPAMRRIGIGSPASVPVGQYAKEALTALDLYEKLMKMGKLVLAKDARQALVYADRGETNGSFVYKTDALLARNAVILLEVPANLHSRISYRMALTSSGAKRQEVRRFYQFIIENSSPVVRRYGFTVPE